MDSESGPVQTEGQTLRRHGPKKSEGSKTHNDGNCAPCAFYCYSKIGCVKGSSCPYCHMFHPKKKHNRERRTRKTKDTATIPTGDDNGNDGAVGADMGLDTMENMQGYPDVQPEEIDDELNLPDLNFDSRETTPYKDLGFGSRQTTVSTDLGSVTGISFGGSRQTTLSTDMSFGSRQTTPHLTDLGFDSRETTPLFTSPMARMPGDPDPLQSQSGPASICMYGSSEVYWGVSGQPQQVRDPLEPMKVGLQAEYDDIMQQHTALSQAAERGKMITDLLEDELDATVPELLEVVLLELLKRRSEDQGHCRPTGVMPMPPGRLPLPPMPPGGLLPMPPGGLPPPGNFGNFEPTRGPPGLLPGNFQPPPGNFSYMQMPIASMPANDNRKKKGRAKGAAYSNYNQK